jgi:hypothetical protein
MTLDAITRLFKKAHDAFPHLEGKPSDNDLLAIRATLLPLLMVVPYDQLNKVHSLTAILTEAVKYKANHGAKFICPACLSLYDKTIADNATTVVCIGAEASNKFRLNDYASYKAAKQGVSKFLHDVVDEIWYNDLKNANTLYTKVMTIHIMSLLDANSKELHALNMILLCSMDMMQYYLKVDGIPQFIVLMEDSQKRLNRLACLSLMLNLSLWHRRLSWQPSTSHVRSTLGKASCPHLARGKPGRWLSTLPTSSASANSKLQGVANPLAVPMR